MKNLTLFIITLLAYSSFGQKHDYNWVFGSPTINDEPYNGSIWMNFNTDPVSILELPNQKLNFDLAQSSFSNEDGELLFYTNGIKIESVNGEIMENGDSINPGAFLKYYYDYGARCYNCAFFVPSPWDENEVVLVHMGVDINVVAVGNNFENTNTVYYSIIDKSANQGNGKVVAKNVPLLTGIFTPIGATRHANGRDWWVVFMEQYGNKFHKVLIDNEGIHTVGEQVIEEIIPVDHGQNDNPYIFSPDGSKLAFCSKFTGVHIFDFDRCTGELGNMVYVPITVAFTDIGYGTPLAFSPNSRFLYYATEEEVRQLDLWETDIAASEDTVALYDGYTNIYGYPALFGFMQLGPDGKIYGISSGLHAFIVQQPNLKGKDCQVAQHAIQFPYFGFALYYFPNYRLGPLDGSPCDTLGLDNLPMAGFRCEADSLQPLLVTFTDNSFYEPAQWAWDFGDGSASQDTSPVHGFPSPGVYEVCLTVGNAYGEDSFCKKLYLGVSGAGEKQASGGEGYAVFPNPASSEIWVECQNLGGGPREVSLIDYTGRQLLTEQIPAGEALVKLQTSSIPAGLYLLRVKAEGKTIHTERVAIVR